MESEGRYPRRQAWGREPLSLGKAPLPHYFHTVQRVSALAVSELAPCPPFFGEELAGNGIRIGHDGFRRSGGDDAPAVFPSAGAEVDDVVRGEDDVRIVLDDHDRRAEFHQMVQHGDELAHLVHMQSGGRLVEDIHGAWQRTLAELARYLDALGLAAGEGRGGLSQTDVVEPHIFQYGKAAFEYRIIGEELTGLTYGHVQHFRDVQPPIADFEGFVIVALAPAHVAGDVHVG